MSFTIFTDTSGNIDTALARRFDIKVIPFSYYVGDTEYTCINTADFDPVSYYNSLLEGLRVTTSQINPQRYIDYMEPVLKEGNDILFIGMSSGVSGSYASAEIAAAQLKEEYPDRNILLVDSLGASLGEGLLALKAHDLKEEGMSIEDTQAAILSLRENMCQVFTVDDLSYLQRGGRISNATAIAGNLLNLKPLLKGNEHGKIVSTGKVRGRKKIIDTLANKYKEFTVDQSNKRVGISHGNCYDDALKLKELITAINPPMEVVIVDHEPVTGSYLGPGALALYFEAVDGVRYM